MRGMMVTAEGEDYMVFGEASGLKGRTLFTHYAMRNALLPQTTGLALSLGQVLSGALLVEVIFNYPGIGGVLYFSIRQFDYFVIQGIIFTVVLGVALATLDSRLHLSPARSAYPVRDLGQCCAISAVIET